MDTMMPIHTTIHLHLGPVSRLPPINVGSTGANITAPRNLAYGAGLPSTTSSGQDYMPPYILESSNYYPITFSQQQRPLGSDSSTSRDFNPHTLREVLYPNETLPSGSGQANKKRGGSSVQGGNPNKSRKRSSKTTAGMSQSTAYGPTTGFTQQQFSSGQLPPEFNSLWKILNDCRESNNQLIREFSEFRNQTDEKLTTTDGKLTAVPGMLKTLLNR